MIIRVVKRDHPYVMIDKTALEDPRLSFRAKGLHAYLLSKPDDWTPNREQLASVSKEGRDAVEIALKELKTCGYFERKRERCADGTFQFVGIVYEVCRSTTDGKSGSGKPVTGYPATENPLVISKEVKKKENKKTSAAKPRFPAEHYRQVEKAYSEIKGIQPSGDEWGPIQRDIKLMFKAGNTPEQIIACMQALEHSDQPWTDSWTIKTVRMKLPEFRAGKLFGGNGRNTDRIRALQADIEEIDRYLEYQIEARLAKLGWKDGDLSLEESEEKERLECIRTEKMAERAKLVKQLEAI